MFEFDRCVIVDRNRAPVAEGFVRSFADGLLDVTSSHDVSDWLHTGQKVQIYIYNASMGECLYGGEVQSALLHHVRIDSMQMVTNRQKRNSTRVDTELAYVVCCYRDPFAGNDEQTFEKPVPITVLNVSAEGMLIACRERRDVGFCFVFTFRETERDIPLVAEIVRRETFPAGFRYGCQLTGLSENERNEIHRWVFSQQIEQRRRQNF